MLIQSGLTVNVPVPLLRNCTQFQAVRARRQVCTFRLKSTLKTRLPQFVSHLFRIRDLCWFGLGKYPERVKQQSPGSPGTHGAPWVLIRQRAHTLKGLYKTRLWNPFRVHSFTWIYPRVRPLYVATLGFVVQPRWGKNIGKTKDLIDSLLFDCQ